jgi:hypothetical protein
MAVRWPGAVLLVLALLWCCCAVSHGRVVPAGLDPPSLPSGSVREVQRGGGELSADDFDGIIVWMRRDGEVSVFPPHCMLGWGGVFFSGLCSGGFRV